MDTLLWDWDQRASADQQHFWKNANAFVVELQRKVARASTLLQQLTTQTEAQKQLVDDMLANLGCPTDKKLEEVDVAITSVSASILLMEDTIALATLALPTILDLKG